MAKVYVDCLMAFPVLSLRVIRARVARYDCWKQMQTYSVPLPPSGLLSTFDGVIQPVIAQLKALTFANQKLHAARNLLLPRLINGEISV